MNKNVAIAALSVGSFILGTSIGYILGTKDRERCEESSTVSDFYDLIKTSPDFVEREWSEINEAEFFADLSSLDNIEKKITDLKSENDRLTFENQCLIERLDYISEVGEEKESILDEDYEDENERIAHIPDQNDDEGDIFIISVNQFSDEHREYSKSTLVYFEEDNVVCTDRDEVLIAPEDIIGDVALDSFGVLSEDDDVVYIRNNNISSDFEIVREHASYQETVFGIVNDDENYKNARKFFELDDD